MAEIKFGCRNGEIISFNIKPLLSFAEMNTFISTVVSAAFSSDRYDPVVVPFIINAMVIKHYAQADIDMTDDIAIELAYDNDIIRRILNVVSEVQYNDMLSAIDKGITFRQRETLSTERKLLNESILRSENMAEQAVQCIEAFTKLAEQFEGIDPKETLEILKKFSDRSDADLVSAILDNKDRNIMENVTHLPLNGITQ